MSSSTKDKSSKKPFGIAAIVRRKKSKRKNEQVLSAAAESAPRPLEETDSLQSGGARTPTPDSITLVESIDFKAESMAEDYEARIAQLTKELHEVQEDLDAAEDKIDRDAKTVEKLKEELDQSKKEAEGLREKVTEFEKVSGELDDESYGAAQEFQLKQQIDKLQGELDQRKNLEKELLDTKVEFQDVRSQLETLQFQQNQSTTRSKMQNMREEKSTKEEVARLQKDLRAMERKFQQETSHLEAQVKAIQDSLQRAQDKTKVVQQRHDEVDKERLQLKIENQRLEKKLEKADSYTERKRLQMEQETAELELSNLKRKNAKLEKRLSMSTQQLNLIDEGRETSVDGSLSSRNSFATVPTTLSEAKIINLEKELQQLSKENDALKERATTAEQNAEVLSLRVKELDEKLMQEKETTVELETKIQTLKGRAEAAGSGKLQDELERLEIALKESETKFHVKEKDLWATVEAQKKQIQELEMEKLKLELGEDEEEGEANDVEAHEATKEGDLQMRERVESLQVELEALRGHNLDLQQELVKQKKESEEFMKQLENELEEVNSKESAREDTLIQKNEELRQRLEEKSEQYEECLHEIERMKDIQQANVKEKAQEENMIQKNEELKQILEEKSEQYEESLHEIERLKDIIDKQEEEIIELQDSLVNPVPPQPAEDKLRNGDTKEKVEKEMPSEPPVNDQQQQVLAKVKATGGVQMMIIPNENQAPPTTKRKSTRQEGDEVELAPTLTPKFKKPPPAIKKKPSRKKASESS